MELGLLLFMTGVTVNTGKAALQQVNRNAQSTLPTLGYVGACAFANVLLAITGSIAMRF